MTGSVEDRQLHVVFDRDPLAVADVGRSPGPQCPVGWRSEWDAVGEETVGGCPCVEVAVTVQVLALVSPHGAVVRVGEDIDTKGVGDVGERQDVIPNACASARRLRRAGQRTRRGSDVVRRPGRR